MLPKPASVQQIEQLWGASFQLHPAPVHNFDLHVGLMAHKAQHPKYLLDDQGRLIGLNLAATGLDDTRWEKILRLLGPDAAHLRALNLNENQLTAFPPDRNLSGLVWLDLSENGIRDFGLPEGNRQLANLRMDENPLENPPREILEQGNAAVLRYLYQLQKEKGKQDYLFEAKLLIIGEAGAGKTTFARRLKDENAPMPSREESTHGINIDKWTFQVTPEEVKETGNQEVTFHVNLWDFGGQDLYHGTHQFFFSHQSLYVLLADTREQKTDFSYWLNTIEQLAGEESSLFILFNKRENHTWKFDEIGFKTRFGDMLKETKTVDLSIPEKLTPLQERIRFWMKNLPGIGQELIESWVRIREDLSKEIGNFISFDRFLEICRLHGQTEPKDISLISTYFNRIGVFTHYLDDPLLRDRIYLNSNWLCKTVYRLLEDETIAALNGKLTKKQVELVWAESNLLWEVDKLSALLGRFGLMYQAGKNEYIIPEHLPQQQPYEKWRHEDDKELLHFRYRFDKYMPKGLMSRLIVSLHRYIKDHNLVWNRGFNLEHQGAYAEIVEDYGANNQFDIKIAGTLRRDLLVIITQAFDHLLAQFAKINPEKGIKCPCEECNHIKTPYFHSTQDIETALIKKAHKKTPKVECKKSSENIPVKRLLALIDYEKVLSNVQERVKNDPDFSVKLEQINGILIGFREEFRDEMKGLNEKLDAFSNDQKTILQNLEQDRISPKKQEKALTAIQDLLKELLAQKKLQPDQLKTVTKINQAPDLKSKLKWSIPLIPAILSYETEMAWDWQKAKKSLRGIIT